MKEFMVEVVIPPSKVVEGVNLKHEAIHAINMSPDYYIERVCGEDAVMSVDEFIKNVSFDIDGVVKSANDQYKHNIVLEVPAVYSDVEGFLAGKTIKNVNVDGYEVMLEFTDGSVFEYQASDGGYSNYIYYEKGGE